MKLTQYVCNTCRSQEVEEMVWRDCNTGECCGIGEAEEDDCWCRDCQTSCKIVDINDYKTTKKQSHA